jgi:hypothetical protein
VRVAGTTIYRQKCKTCQVVRAFGAFTMVRVAGRLKRPDVCLRCLGKPTELANHAPRLTL